MMATLTAVDPLPSVRDIGDGERKHDRDKHHEHRTGVRRAHEVRPQVPVM